jgi:hypothetical protein
MDIVGTVTLPARLGFRIALWGARTVGGLLPIGDGDEPGPPGPPVEEPPRPAPAETVARPAAAEAPPPEPEPVEPVEPPEPAHVDEGATVVAEFAEEGAEDGAGAEIELTEPWKGYDRLHADELVDRLSGAGSAELAAVVLYERSTRDRSSVVEAAERQLRARTT